MVPLFLSRAQINEAHRASLERHGGLVGLRSEHAIESALAAPINDYHYAGADLFALAAAYAFHIAQAQAFLDGNKRTAVLAALIFLEVNGVSTEAAETFSLHEDMLAVASRQMTKADLAVRFRSLFGRSGGNSMAS